MKIILFLEKKSIFNYGIFIFQMRENYVTVKKAFLAFDAHKDGFISLDNLRSVLSHFTIPMTAQLFTRLMERSVYSVHCFVGFNALASGVHTYCIWL